MCTSTANLLYGLWVTTASLAFAATAHHRTRSPFLAIDLILLRRRSGSLKVRRAESRRLLVIPPEVWGEIKHQLIQLEMYDATVQAIAPLRCRQCSSSDPVSSLLTRIRVDFHGENLFSISHKRPWDYWGAPECAMCLEKVDQDGIYLLTPERRELINQLLESYSLSMADKRVLSTDPSGEAWDFESLVAISLPLCSTDYPETPRVEAEYNHEQEESPYHTVAHILPSVFDLPADAHRRFASLVATYGLKAGDPATVKIMTSSSSQSEAQDNTPKTKKAEGAGSAKGKEKDKKDERELKFGRVEPRWMLWSVGDPCM